MKQIQGFEDYFVDEAGNIYSKKSGVLRLRKPWKSHGGYLYIELCKSGVKYRKGVHQIVAETYCEGWFEGAVVNHKDTNKENNIASNLEWVTQKENVHYTYNKTELGPIRNYKKFQIIKEGQTISPILIGGAQVKQFIKDNNLNISASSLIKYRHSKGYKLIILQ